MTVRTKTAMDRFAVQLTEGVLRYRWLVILASLLGVLAIASQA